MKYWKMHCLTFENKIWSSRLQWTLVSHLICPPIHSTHWTSFLCSRHLFPFHICNCPWWSCHVCGISLPFLRNYKLTTWCHASFSLHDPLSLPSPTTSNQCHVRDFWNLPRLITSLKHSLVTYEAEQLCTGTKKTNSRRICFKDVGLLLIMVHSPASIVPIKKGLIS